MTISFAPFIVRQPGVFVTTSTASKPALEHVSLDRFDGGTLPLHRYMSVGRLERRVRLAAVDIALYNQAVGSSDGGDVYGYKEAMTTGRLTESGAGGSLSSRCRTAAGTEY